MTGKRRSIYELLAMGVIAGVLAFALAYATRPGITTRATARGRPPLSTRHAVFELRAETSQLVAKSLDGALGREIDLSFVVDGVPRPFSLARKDLHPASGPGAARDTLVATVPVPIGDASVDATLELVVDAARDALRIVVTAPPGADVAGHEYALRAELESDGQVVFVPGVGPIADRATVEGAALVVDAEPHPIAIASNAGPVVVDALSEEARPPGDPARVSATSPARGPDGNQLAELHVVLAESSMAVWRDLADLAGVPTAPVRGRVTGTGERAYVIGRDAQGDPLVRALASEGGTFALDVPSNVVEWYASIDPARASGLASFVPGTPHELLLDVSPGGELKVTITDADTHKPLTARLLVRGIDGTVDPSFGPDYRASGAGPVIDALRGDVDTPLPAGRYRVAATKGIEWTIDAKIVDIVPGRTAEAELAPRHVVPTPGVLGCDLHVHARPSFDTPVAPEDRVLSLAAAGIDFAVPTEHNLVGDYTSSIETLDLRGELLSVPGVEVTTYSKGFGHFGVFPYPVGAPVPPFKHTTMGAIFHAVRAGDKSRYFQLNHPRLPKGIGYFNNIGFDPNGPRGHVHNRIDFDGIEVYNGYDIEKPERVEQVLHDYWALLDFGWRYAATGSSDSHRIQFHWAGYPRTFVTVDPNATVDTDSKPVDPLVVVANIKKGHAVVTSGPLIELTLGGARPGDETITTADPIHGHVRVRAAPWVDVATVEIVAGQIGGGWRIVESYDVPTRPTAIGPEAGTLAEAQDRTIRFDRDIDVAVGPENGWVMVLVHGNRRMDDVLPFMPAPPLGFTNPVYVVRSPAPPPPYPGMFAAPAAPTSTPSPAPQ
jgi:hypothetical protein